MNPEPGAGGPRGTVTFLFTDMEGSTRLLQQIGAAYSRVLEEQRRLAWGVFERHGGHLVDTAGDGFFVVFARARDALAATVQAQRALLAHAWPPGATVRVRMGLHTGEPVVSGASYTGMDVHRAARIMSAAHGGQIVLSEATRQLVAGDLPDGVELLDLGEHALKDLPRLERLYQVRGEGLPAAFPPLRTAGRAPGANLPGRALPLIGRDDELSSVHALLRRPEVRLLTLTGTGGTGKTSLAVEVAARCIADFPDGIAYVALAPVVEPSLVFTAIAQTLAVAPRAGEEPLGAVIEQLRECRLLLVLDNFEQVMGAATGVAALAAACPGVKTLVTSRFALRLSMEREYPVSPLRTPDAAVANAALLRAYPAVQLFAERAAAVKPGFGLDDDSAYAVAQICHRLDGLPLAIELAAARIKLFSPRALLARLDHRLELLSGGARDLPDRHRTLRGAIGWSYDLLDAGERAAFRRLAVFAGSFPLEAAEAVCAAAGEPVLQALDAVSALVDKSLLRQVEEGDGEPRFQMLDTVREFAREQLAAAGEEAATRAAHADVLIALAERAAPELAGSGQSLWVPRLEREHDDLRAALDWTTRTGDASHALRLGAALCRFWLIRGFHTEGRRWLRAVLALPHPAGEAAVRARVLSGAAILAYEQGDLDEGTAQLEEALAQHRAAGDPRGVGDMLNHMGWVAFYAGELERARALTEEGLSIHEQRGDVRGVSLSLTNLGAITLHGGDVRGALELYGRALELRRSLNEGRSIAYGALNLSWALVRAGEIGRALALTGEAERTLRALGDKQLLGYACFVLAEAALEQGRPADALPLMEEAIALGRDVMQGSTFGLALAELAEALADTGEPDRAVELARESVAVHERTGTRVWLVLSLRCLGDVLRLAGDAAGAREAYLRALDAGVPRGIGLHLPECLAGLAALAAQDGRHEPALRLVSASRALRAAAGRPASTRRGPDLDAIEAAAARALGPAEAERARAKGATLARQRLDEVPVWMRAVSD